MALTTMLVCLFTFLMFFILPALAMKGYIFYSVVLTAAYTTMTFVIYEKSMLVAMCLLVTLLSWVIVYAGFAQRKWAKAIKNYQSPYKA